MKVLITGSHFTPAQAVIEQLLKEKAVNIVYVGRKHALEGDQSLSVESQVLPKLGIKFIPLTTGRLRRSFEIKTIISILKIPIGFFQAFLINLRERPDVVLSFGGYVGVPIVISAWLLSIPIIVHEQTLVSGLANTISSLFTEKVAVSFDQEHSFDKNKMVLTGNPMRREIVHPTNSPSPEVLDFFKSNVNKLPIILVSGGNQGSHIINESVFKILDELTEVAVVIHQTGDSAFKDWEKLNEKRGSLKNPQRYLVKKWIDASDFGYVLSRVDLAVSRAGANTLLELAYFGIPTLVVPIPYIFKDEQRVNAKYFEKLGLVMILPQSELAAETLLQKVKNMIKQLDTLKAQAKQSRRVVVPDAAKRLMLEVLLLR